MRRWLPEVDRLVIATFVEGSEGVQGALWDAARGRGMVPDRRARGNAQPKGGFVALIDDAARGLDIRLGAPATALAWNAARRHRDARRAARRLAADRAVITLPVGLLRDGRFRLDPLPPPEQQKAIGRLGYGAGVLGKIYLRFPHRFWPEKSKWFGRLPDAPDRRGTFNTFVSHVEETGLPILLSFANGALRRAARPRSSSDEEVKQVAHRRRCARCSATTSAGARRPSSFRAGSVRSLDAGRLFLSRRSAARRRTTTIMPGRSATACSSPARRPSRSSTAPCMPPSGRPSRRPRRCSGRPPARSLARHAAVGQARGGCGPAQWVIESEHDTANRSSSCW